MFVESSVKLMGYNTPGQSCSRLPHDFSFSSSQTQPHQQGQSQGQHILQWPSDLSSDMELVDT